MSQSVQPDANLEAFGSVKTKVFIQRFQHGRSFVRAA